MTVTRFEGGGPVARYWLANCEGFVTKGATRGVVEELIRDADPHVTTRLVIRTRAHRRRIISAGAVSEVIPADSVLIVSHRRARRSVHRSRRASLFARGRVGLARAAHALSRRVLSAATTIASTRPVRFSSLGTSRRAVAFAVVARSFGRSSLLVLARSFHSLAYELQATVRMLLRSTSGRKSPRRRSRRR
jgi:hypothetical protein